MTVPARFAVVDPVATTTDLLLVRTFAGTDPETFTLPARATLTLIDIPAALAKALTVTFLGTVATGAPRRRAGPPDGGPPAGGRPDVGRNAATSAPPIAPCEAVGEITTGGEVSAHGSAGGGRRTRHLEAAIVGPRDARRIR